MWAHVEMEHPNLAGAVQCRWRDIKVSGRGGERDSFDLMKEETTKTSEAAAAAADRDAKSSIHERGRTDGRTDDRRARAVRRDSLETS